MSEGKKVKILPTTVTVSGIGIMDFILKFPEYFKLMGLKEMRGFNLTFNFPNVHISFNWRDKDTFNMTSNKPETLNKLIDIIETQNEG